jgi:hypothetical protein
MNRKSTLKIYKKEGMQAVKWTKAYHYHPLHTTFTFSCLCAVYFHPHYIIIYIYGQQNIARTHNIRSYMYIHKDHIQAG